MSQLKVNSIVPVGGLPSGSNGGIIQTVQTVKTNVQSTTSSSMIDISGMSVAITPSSNSNNVLIMVSLNYGGDSNMYAAVNLLRGSTVLTKGDEDFNTQTECTFGIGGDNSNFQYKMGSASYSFLDTGIATTSETTYKLQIQATGASGQRVVINAPYEGGYQQENEAYSMRGTSTITVFEVSA